MNEQDIISMLAGVPTSKPEKQADIASLLDELNSVRKAHNPRASLNGEVKTRKMTSEELEQAKIATPFATSLRAGKEPRWQTTIPSKLVMRFIEQACKAQIAGKGDAQVIFAQLLSKHYGQIFPYKLAMEIAERGAQGKSTTLEQ